MNKSELIEELSREAGLSQADAKRAVNALFDLENGVIVSALRAGEDVTITGFGKFEIRTRGPRVARNPRTGEEINVPESKAPAFKAGAGFKKAIAGN